jgi:hypothetical protein
MASPGHIRNFYTNIAPIMDDRGCWEWLGTVTKNGFPSAKINGQNTARRVAWTLEKGQLNTNELIVDTCGNPICVNPFHLKTTTRAEISRNGNGLKFLKEFSQNKLENATCNRGHLYQDFLYIAKNGKRRCNKCHAITVKEYRKKYPEKDKATVKKWRKNNIDKILIFNLKRKCLKLNAEGSFTLEEWNEVCKKQNNKCNLCPYQGKLTKDHIIPLSKGGTNFISNIQGLCGPCNSRKWNHL